MNDLKLTITNKPKIIKITDPILFDLLFNRSPFGYDLYLYYYPPGGFKS